MPNDRIPRISCHKAVRRFLQSGWHGLTARTDLCMEAVRAVVDRHSCRCSPRFGLLRNMDLFVRDTSSLADLRSCRLRVPRW
jgi:hypothetical protein